jgi:hypothetical protein
MKGVRMSLNESPSMKGLWVGIMIGWVLCVGLLGAALYVAVHFIAKFW